MENFVKSNNWYLVDDVVMGGRSSGNFNKTDDFILFHGEISLENGGGFSSIRCELEPHTKINKKVKVECAGDGRSYEIICKSKDQTAYRAAFNTDKHETTLHDILIENFEASFRGRKVNAEPLEKVEIEEIGIILADGQQGEFKLKIYSFIIK